MLNFFKNLSPTEIIILSVILIVLFGSKVFIRLARTAGQSLRELKSVKKTFTDAVEGEDKEEKDNV